MITINIARSGLPKPIPDADKNIGWIYQIDDIYLLPITLGDAEKIKDKVIICTSLLDFAKKFNLQSYLNRLEKIYPDGTDLETDIGLKIEVIRLYTQVRNLFSLSPEANLHLMLTEDISPNLLISFEPEVQQLVYIDNDTTISKIGVEGTLLALNNKRNELFSKRQKHVQVIYNPYLGNLGANAISTYVLNLTTINGATPQDYDIKLTKGLKELVIKIALSGAETMETIKDKFNTAITLSTNIDFRNVIVNVTTTNLIITSNDYEPVRIVTNVSSGFDFYTAITAIGIGDGKNPTIDDLPEVGTKLYEHIVAITSEDKSDYLGNIILSKLAYNGFYGVFSGIITRFPIHISPQDSTKNKMTDLFSDYVLFANSDYNLNDFLDEDFDKLTEKGWNFIKIKQATKGRFFSEYVTFSNKDITDYSNAINGRIINKMCRLVYNITQGIEGTNLNVNNGIIADFEIQRINNSLDQEIKKNMIQSRTAEEEELVDFSINLLPEYDYIKKNITVNIQAIPKSIVSNVTINISLVTQLS